MTNTPQKHVTEPQTVTHKTYLMGFFPGNTALTFSDACFIGGRVQGAAETASGSQF